MIQNIAFTQILGLPVIAYGGMTTLLLVLFTSIVGFLNYRGITTIPFKWHPVLALLTIIFSLVHGIMGLSIFLGF